MNINDLIPFYALGALSEEEQAFVESYLKEHPDKYAELHELQIGADALALSLEPIAPDPATKQLLMARVANDARASAYEPSPTKPKSSWWQRLGFGRAPALVGYAFALLLLVWALSLRNEQQRLEQQVAQLETQAAVASDQIETLERSVDLQIGQIAQLEREADGLRAEVDSLKRVNESLREELESDRLLLALLRDPDVAAFELEQTGVQETARGRFVVNEQSQQALLTVAGLTPLPASQSYQFWLIGSDGPIDAGLLDVGGDGTGLLLLDAAVIEQFEAIGLSIEPAGGSTQPTGDIVLLGGLQ